MGKADHNDRRVTHEADPADVAEQEALIDGDEEASSRAEREQILRRSPEAPEADVSEQAVEVVEDDEDWR